MNFQTQNIAISTTIGIAKISVHSSTDVHIEIAGVTVNRVEIEASGNFTLTDGKWTRTTNSHGITQSYSLTVKKLNSSLGNSEVSDKTRNKVQEAFRFAITAWAHNNQNVLKYAEIAKMKNRLDTEIAKVKELQKFVAQSEETIRDLNNRVAELENALNTGN